MLIPTSTRTKSVAVLAMLWAAFAAPRMWADIVTYTASSAAPAATLGNTTLDSCGANIVCVEVSITFVADTANIVPFSVVGASGFENFVGQGSVNLFDFVTGQSLSANFDANQIYVSVDQTNGGIGFGSAIGPTYPLAVYAGTPSTPYLTYDLASDFTVFNAFAWFCAFGSCTLGQPGPALATDQGPLSITPYGPVAFSQFTATVAPSPVPEPSAIVLVAFVVAIFALRLGLRSPRGI